MKVKLKNTHVDIWKLRKGVVVMCGGHVGHIDRIAIPNNPSFGDDVLVIDVISAYTEHCVMSTDVTWLEPHD
jgi:hypothetical protein